MPMSLQEKFQSNPVIELGKPPLLFNSKGEQMKFCFLKSWATAHTPYTLITGRNPRRILWDRYNYSLDTHFYGDINIFSWEGNPTKKYGFACESEVIIPEVYHFIRKNGDKLNELDGFFTHKPEFLENFSNAKFMPASGVWYGTEYWHGNNDIHKTKGISMVASTKTMCQFHIFRKEVALHMMQNPTVDMYGRIAGKFASCGEIFQNYRYSIVIENNVEPYYFTEKVMNCFAAKTVPIYIGATKIGKFFNTDGMIIVKEPTIEAVDKALRQCSEADYENRKSAIDDNYNRVQHFLCMEDYICENYPEILL